MGRPINHKPKGRKRKDDEGLWKVGDNYHEISEMEDDFLETAFYHSLKKIGEHSERIKKAMSSLSKFEDKSKEIYQEMRRRGISDRVDQTPSEALRKSIGNRISISHEKEAS